MNLGVRQVQQVRRRRTLLQRGFFEIAEVERAL